MKQVWWHATIGLLEFLVPNVVSLSISGNYMKQTLAEAMVSKWAKARLGCRL